MEKSTRLKFLFNVAITLATVWMLAPTMWSLAHPDDTDKIPAWMPKTAMKLGLDLQGGIHMVMGVDLDKVVRDQLASYGRNVESAADTAGVKGLSSKVIDKDFELEITAGSPVDREKVADIVSKDFSGTLEFVGDSGNIVVLRLSRPQEDYIRTKTLEQSIETIRNRIDEFGVAEPIISRKGDSQILVQFPGAKEPERLKNLIGQTAQLNFQIVHECTDGACMAQWTEKLETWIKDAEKAGNYQRETFPRLSDYRAKINTDLAAKLPKDTIVSFERVRDINVNGAVTLRPFLLSTTALLSGEYIENAYITQQSRSQMAGPEMPVVAFQMNAVGAPLMGKLTGEHVNRYMAIVLDGIVKSAPVINSEISGSGIITLGSGGFEEMSKEAGDLALVLRAGALPATIEVQEERVIGPSIGRDAIVAGKKALMLSGLFVLLFTALYYGAAGLIAGFVTAVNVGMIVAFLGAMGATLTLPGIAGVVLTIGMAVDALIIIYERMREEVRLGRTPKQVVTLGFENAFSTILDSNVTTAIGAFVLLQYGTGSIRGFALTLLVGILVNVFTATFYARNIFETLMQSKIIQRINVGLGAKELTEVHA